MTQDEIVTDAVRDAIYEVIWPLSDWDGDRCVAFNAAGAAARAAITAMSTAQEPALDDDAEERLIEQAIGRKVVFENDLLTIAEVRRVIRLQTKAPETGEA